MLFNSYVFVFAFLPLALAGWWSLPGKQPRLVFLALSSYLFYGWWDWRFVPLMVLSSSADFAAGSGIAGTDSPGRKRAYLIALLVFNLGILGVFKYFDFFAGTLNGLGRATGLLAPSAAGLPLLRVTLPIGISFYTFNSISYTIDVYRGRLAPARSFLEFSAFVAMFPHLVAGPIVRYRDMNTQFAELPPRLDPGFATAGVWFFAVGLVKKVLVADPIAANLVDPLFPRAAHLGAIGGWTATLAYTMQIYFDFSGYSDMAIGLALLLGLQFPQNFHSPYKSTSIAEFWRRWHMSLSFWLRDYLFIPLGGSKGGAWRTARNLAITMFLGGLWHGAAWTFVLWGLYHGVLLVIHAGLKRAGVWPRSRVFGVASTFVAVMIGWVLFRAPTLRAAGQMLGALFGAHGIEGGGAVRELLVGKAPLMMLAATVCVFALPNTWEIRWPRARWAAAILAAAFVLCALRFESPSPFLYFQF